MRHYALTPLFLGTLFFLCSYLFPTQTSFIQSFDQKESQFQAFMGMIDQYKIKGSKNTQENKQQRALQTQTISSIFDQQVYQGTWTGTPGIEQFSFFNGETGIILSQLLYSTDNYSTLQMVLLDPQYDDEKKVDINLDNLENCMVGGDFSWSCLTTIQAYTYYKRSLQKSQNVPIQLTMTATPLNQTIPISPSNSQFTINMVSTSSVTINLNATLTLQNGNFTLMFILYNLFISAFGLQQLLSITYLTKDLQEHNEQYATKFSMLTVGFMTVYDAYVSLAHLYMALEYTNYFYYFLFPTVIYFILTTIQDMKLLIIIWKNRCYIHFTSPAEVRKGFAIFYAKFYLSLILFFTLTYFFYLYNQYLLVLPIFIVPQIVHNYMKGNKPLFLYNYTIGSILSRAIIPFYYRACPDNIRDLAPNLPFSIEFPCIFIFLIFILFLQQKIGPRFFVPKRFQGGFDYFKSYSTSDPLMDEDCPICMSKLSEDPENEDFSASLQLEDTNQPVEISSTINRQSEKLIKKKKIAVTPCNHKYHISCFRAWINVKLECPSCRHPLKPLFD